MYPGDPIHGWTMSDGTQALTTFWQPNEPNDRHKIPDTYDRLCARFKGEGSEFLLKDRDCGRNWEYICERTCKQCDIYVISSVFSTK